jgi:hypothetical protein
MFVEVPDDGTRKLKYLMDDVAYLPFYHLASNFHYALQSNSLNGHESFSGLIVDQSPGKVKIWPFGKSTTRATREPLSPLFASLPKI